VSDSILEEIRLIRSEMATLRDNHLHHIEKDISKMQTDIAVMNEKVGQLEAFNEDVKDFIRGYVQKAVSVMVAALMASLGLASQM